MPSQALNAAQIRALNDALEMAVVASDVDMMNSAMESGADPNILLFKGILLKQLRWVDTAIAHGADVNSSRAGLVNDWRATMEFPVFYWLNRHFDEKVGELLLARGAHIDGRDRYNNTALFTAVTEGWTDSASFLVRHGADPLTPCEDQKIPMLELEHGTWDSSIKLALVKLMVQNRQKQAQGEAAPAAAANDPNAVATANDIELSKPLELRKKPHGGLEL